MFIRKRNRLPNKKLYEANHWYFVTICVYDRQCIFGDIVASVTDGHLKGMIKDGYSNDKVTNGYLNNIGLMIESVWRELGHMFGNIILDHFVVMPNHVHGIIGFDGVPFSCFTKRPTDLGKIIKRFKIETVSRAKLQGYGDVLQWKKSFYDHVIRNQQDLERIQEYIMNNPLQRELDILNKKNDKEYQKKYSNLQS